MMSIAAGQGHRQEIYSIDESFVDLTGIRGDLTERSRKVRERILQWIGIPTCECFFDEPVNNQNLFVQLEINAVFNPWLFNETSRHRIPCSCFCRH